MLKLANVSTAYGAIPVLKELNLEVPQGSITCILGSNGAGKTTAIRTVLGLVKPLGGEVLFCGKRINGLATDEVIKLGIGVVPEGRRIFPKMTVKDNLLVGACNIKDKQAVSANIDKMYAMFPRLAERRKQNAGTMSGGEQQMLAIGRALMSEPKLLLLDEPSLGLAPLIVNDIFQTISQINREGTTILLIEQNGYKALAMSDRAYLLQKGRITAACTENTQEAKESLKAAYLRQYNRGE